MLLQVNCIEFRSRDTESFH